MATWEDVAIERDLLEGDSYHPSAPNYRGDPTWVDWGYASVTGATIQQHIDDLIWSADCEAVAATYPRAFFPARGWPYRADSRLVGVGPDDWARLRRLLADYRGLMDTCGPQPQEYADRAAGATLADGRFDPRAGVIGQLLVADKPGDPPGHGGILCKYCASLLGIALTGWRRGPEDPEDTGQDCDGCGALVRATVDPRAAAPVAWPEADPDTLDDVPF